MKILALMMLIAGCSTQAGDDDYPVIPGGAVPPPVASDTGMLKGQACVLTDPRDLTSCATSGAAGLTVRLDGETTTTDADGSFAIPAPSTTGSTPSPAMLGITGPGMVPTQIAVPDASGPMSIPLFRADLFSQMMAANGITPSSGSGSILGTVARGGAPLAGVGVTSTPSPAFGPLFDGSTPTSWTLDATGARGVWWIPGVAIGPTRLTFRDLASSGETTVDGVQVIDGGITILDAVLP